MDGASTVRILPEDGDGDRPAGSRSAVVVVMRGPEIGRRYPLGEDATIIGRHAEVTITIEDKSISRRHCEIVKREDGDQTVYAVRELGSTNGTRLNGTPIDDAVLADGDRLTVGDVVLKFMFLDTVEQSFHHEISDMLRTDRQTGLLHVDAFYSDLDSALDHARAADETLALLMLDIDGLKQVNDTHGHLLGTEVVRAVAAELRRAGAEGHVVPALYGGDEFILYMPNAQEAAAVALGERIRDAVAATNFSVTGGHLVGVTLSGGVVEFPRDGQVREVLVRRSDLALYAAKHEGRNRVVPFRPALDTADRSGNAKQA